MEGQWEDHAPRQSAHHSAGLSASEADACLEPSSHEALVLPVIRRQRSRVVSPSNLRYHLQQLMLVRPGYGLANNTKESGGSSFGVVSYWLYNINPCQVGYTLELVGTPQLI